jgi:hypothetical protein
VGDLAYWLCSSAAFASRFRFFSSSAIAAFTLACIFSWSRSSAPAKFANYFLIGLHSPQVAGTAPGCSCRQSPSKVRAHRSQSPSSGPRHTPARGPATRRSQWFLLVARLSRTPTQRRPSCSRSGRPADTAPQTWQEDRVTGSRAPSSQCHLDRPRLGGLQDCNRSITGR